jgi:hypothetical protein
LEKSSGDRSSDGGLREIIGSTVTQGGRMASWFTADQIQVTRLCLLAMCLLARSFALAQEPKAVLTPGDSELRFRVRDELAATPASPFDNSTADLSRRLAEVEARLQERDEADFKTKEAASN